MRVEVITPPLVKPVAVQLNLSIDEFALLEVLRYRHLNGNNHLRTRIERGFDEAFDALDIETRAKIKALRPSYPPRGSNSDLVFKAFA